LSNPSLPQIILCPLLGAVTYIDEARRNRTFKFELLEKFGCTQELASRLTYAYDKVSCSLRFEP
jgi:polo-like kinase 1